MSTAELHTLTTPKSADRREGRTKRPGVLDIPSMKGRCSDAEWQARIDLAACYRLVDLYGMSDMMANHISSHVPDEHGAFLINPYGMMYEEITASSLIKVDVDGNILAQPDFGDLDYGINKAGYVIHSAVHAARPEVACVIHTHSWASMAVSSLACGLLPLTQTAMRFLKIGYHDYRGVVLHEEEQESLLADLGAGEAVMFRNHGALVVGRSVGEAFNWMHRLELACRAQIGAMSCGTPLAPVPRDVLEETWNNYQPGTRRPYGLMEWPALLRKLDRMDPGFRD
jgi:ribulose-5-phosphate 4-epimerase/fuculose-1-phosphate aldolase